jgi:hypothetical protein
MVLFLGPDASSLAARRFTASTAWSSPPADFDTRGDAGTTTVSGADVAVDPAGNAIVIWTTNMSYVVSKNGNVTTYGSRSELRSQHFSVVDGWSFAYDRLDLGATSEHALGLDDAGNGFALGVLEKGEVRASRWLPQSGWQPSTLLGQVAAQGWSTPAAHPLLSVLHDGRAVALWRSGNDLVMRRFGD